MSTVIALCLVVGSIALAIIAGIGVRALQSGKNIIDQDGAIRIVPALGRSVGRVVAASTFFSAVALLLVFSILHITVDEEPQYEMVGVFATLVASLVGFCIASSSGYDQLIEYVEKE